MASEPTEIYDLLILVDATYSMRSYLNSLQTSLPQIIQISALTDCFSRIGLLAYRDYCDKDLLDWSGWLTPSSDTATVVLVARAKKLNPLGGGDGPEATKTGLARAYELMRVDATTIILLFTDAPPHSFSNGSLKDTSSNYGAELKALSDETCYGGHGLQFVDWVSAANSLRSGDKKAQVFSILERDMRYEEAGYYNYLSAMTGGTCFYLAKSSAADISQVTVDVLLSWMGAGKAGAVGNPDLPAFLTRYADSAGMMVLKNEKDLAACKFFLATSDSAYDSVIPDAGRAAIKRGAANVIKIKASSDVLKKFLPKKNTPVLNFAKRYAVDADYRRVALRELKKIIDTDVVVISLNPIFGSLWRDAVADRDHEARDELVKVFGSQVDRIADANEKARMRIWLEESYDFTSEVAEAIESVPVDQRFPCVCLDPTLSFTSEDNGDEDDRPVTKFRRDELLEIGRSCDYRILRRLGRILTRLTYINSVAEMPAHIAAAESDVVRIPMALASRENKRKFWKILLHIIVPGTMLAGRPAAVLAALSLKLGIQPLMDAADQELLRWRDRWNNLESPETWNSSCLSLLLDADDSYRKRREVEMGLEGLALDDNATPNAEGLLNAKDRQLFNLLVSYKLLELNLDTNLEARIGWTPEKSSAPLGPTVVCASCKYPRSVTIMGKGGNCGLCLWNQVASWNQFPSREERERIINAHVSKFDDENTPATWVECNLSTCRAQYVVYRAKCLNVKPKCHYCRHSTQAPALKCSDCKNRIIYPLAYRPADMKVEDFKCFACTAGRQTIVKVETTAKKLRAENGTKWLLRNDKKIAEPFNQRSLFHTISTAGTDGFTQDVELFPAAGRRHLTINGKSVLNSPELIATLESWISRRKVERGTCSLCCSDKRKSDLLLACGRSGCDQYTCKDCLDSWYGLNKIGRVINTAALACAFCRRPPTAKTLFKYGQGIHAVGNLRLAVEKGEWIFAWCRTCGFARRYMERVCAQAAPANLSNWECDGCKKYEGSPTVKKCPGCQTWTEKSAGCDHIACIVQGCGTHWCFHCGKKQTSSTIYDHMQKEHGGYYGGGAYEGAAADADDGYETDY
ncbi:uncharacterized protein LY89DRAFT_652250 [Mollisia scopiformis]|uniref:RBR-type E3 ubiquitin transferase n=1 Tax=Mollisia scopiformis TaxID=149040 RepID=A0A194WY42_MOLSC|nr:uncharacterized protein LY89DRAFT_652250 [Mollisia scopiformis]KUJ12891.1 hypothetical protein LY89DRAFT_652250 [Mollisia scopiformis]